jgi:hypothetical protein
MTQQQEKEIISKRKNGVKLKELQKEYDIKSVKTIYDIIKRDGVKKIGNKKYWINENFFETIDSDEKSYWLGFLYADGCIRKKGKSSQLKLKLKLSDIEHLEKFKKSIQSDSEIKKLSSFFKKDKKEYSSECCEINIYNTKVVEDLIKLGCLQNKTQKIRLPNLDFHLMSSFIRGYFDGDGCIYKVKNYENCFRVTICSNKNFIKDLKVFLNYGDIVEYNNYSILAINKIENIKEFRDYIYNNSNISLTRKYEKFLLIKEYSPEYYTNRANNFKKNIFKL